MIRTSYLIVFLMLIGCSDMTEKPDVPPELLSIEDVRSLCDGTEGIVLGMRANAGHNAPYRVFYYENGARYIYINGKCEFWTWGILPKHVQNWDGNRMSIATGQLNEEQALRFLNLIAWKSWSNLDGTMVPSLGFGEDTNFHFYAGEMSFDFSLRGATLDPQYSDRLVLVDHMYDAMEYLIALGEPFVGAEMRLYVGIASIEGESTWNNLDPPPFIFEWSPTFSVYELGEDQKFYCAGDSLLIGGEEALRLRETRWNYRKAADEVTFLSSAVIGERGLHHEVFVRDVLPFENSFGFVPYKSRYISQKCE